MEDIKIKTYLRSEKGKKKIKNLLKENKLPGIIYSKGENILIYFDKEGTNQINKNIKERNDIITCSINEKQNKFLIKEIKTHPINNKITHIDLQKINEDSVITTKVPINFINQQKCIHIQDGGILIKNISEIKIKGALKNIPKNIEIDLEKLNTKKYIYLQELKNEKLFQIPILNKKKTPNILLCYIKEIKINKDLEIKGK